MVIDCLEKLKGKLIVSCQASEGEPLNAPEHIKALALSALNGGAAGLRLEGIENIKVLRHEVTVPIIGLTKSKIVKNEELLDTVYITATFEEAMAISNAGADIIATDATSRARVGSITVAGLINKIRTELGKPVWADISTVEEGLVAAEAGADVISTTMAGYTRQTMVSPESGPDFVLLGELCMRINKPVVLEGRVWKPEDVRQAFDLGAYAVVVGSAITRPQLITKRFMSAIPKVSASL